MVSNILGMVAIGILSFLYACLQKSFREWFMNKVSTIFKEKFDGNEVNDEFVAIRDKLILLRDYTDADRIHISQFHNGNFFTTSKPIWKLSRIYEVCDVGVSYTSKDYQNVMAVTILDILSGLFSKNPLAERVTNNKCLEKNDVCERPLGVYKYIVDDIRDSHIKFQLKEQGVKWFLQSPLLDGEKNVIGVINIEFLDMIRKEINFCKICETAQEISYILSKK